MLTLFPEMCESVLSTSIIGRARKAGLLDIRCHQIREHSQSRQKRVDDAPYGGGMGMVMQAEPIYQCAMQVCEPLKPTPHMIYMSPQGKPLTQKRALELSKMEHIVVICGHYEGVDERLLEEIVDEEISIGDYVLTGGELAGLVLIDAIGRLCDGVLSDQSCFEEESHFNGLLEYPQYTRPPVWHDKTVPQVLVTGHHKNIETWRRHKSLERTLDKRPDMLKHAPLTKEDLAYLEEYQNQKQGSET